MLRRFQKRGIMACYRPFNSHLVYDAVFIKSTTTERIILNCGIRLRHGRPGQLRIWPRIHDFFSHN
jgi:hypothetical protein